MPRRLSEAAAAVVIAAGLVAAVPAGQAIATASPAPRSTMAPAPGANGLPRGYFALPGGAGPFRHGYRCLGDQGRRRCAFAWA